MNRISIQNPEGVLVRLPSKLLSTLSRKDISEVPSNVIQLSIIYCRKVNTQGVRQKALKTGRGTLSLCLINHFQ